jgi:hypothetical protein
MPTYERGDYVKVEFQDETTVIELSRPESLPNRVIACGRLSRKILGRSATCWRWGLRFIIGIGNCTCRHLPLALPGIPVHCGFLL